MPEYKNGSIVGGGGDDAETISCLWSRPSVAHEWDDEFDSATLATPWSWIMEGGNAATVDTDPIDIYTAYSGAVDSLRYDIRNSWLRIQASPGTGAYEGVYAKKATDFTTKTNCLIYSRLRFQQDLSTEDNEQRVGLHLLYDDNNYYQILLQESDANIQAQAFVYDAGSYVEIGSTTNVGNEGSALEYAAIQKIGNSFFFWAGSETNWIYIGTSSALGVAKTPVTTAIVHGSKTGAAGGPWVGSCDFVRFLDTDKFLIG